MHDLTKLRTAAREIFDEALRAVDADEAVRRAIRINNTTISVGNIETSNRRIYSIAIGKASLSMGHALNDVLGDSLTAGVLVGPAARPEHEEWLLGRWHWCKGGHPLPSHWSLYGAERALELLDRANQEHALVIFLISGGGSAMMEWPIDGDITLANLRIANKVLVNCGASITEINSVRRAFSFIKGGRLAERAPNCDQITLIVSDVPYGEEYNVASGPTLAPNENSPDARDVITRYHLRSELPLAILQAIDNPQEFHTDSDSLREHLVLLSNEDALRSAATAAEQRGFVVEIARDISDQPIADGCDALRDGLQELRAQNRHAPVCLISGGEFGCPVRGGGVGGRNLETGLRLARTTNFSLSNFVALCAGTDGIDGNSPAAGAIVDGTTLRRACAMGLSAERSLEQSDSYSFFAALGEAITTGPTGTNVRDLRILLAERSTNSPGETQIPPAS
jgi:hydroxypyruvate reductase